MRKRLHCFFVDIYEILDKFSAMLACLLALRQYEVDRLGYVNNNSIVPQFFIIIIIHIKFEKMPGTCSPVCEVCFPDEGVKYESDADDYFYDSDIADDSDTSESNNETDDDDQEVAIKID